MFLSIDDFREYYLSIFDWFTLAFYDGSNQIVDDTRIL